MIETRQIIQKKMHILVMNPMDGKMENRNPVAMSFERDNLIKWYNEQLAPEPYIDNIGDRNWHKVFKKGSILEWYNPLDSLEECDGFGGGIQYEWVKDDATLNPSIYYIG